MTEKKGFLRRIFSFGPAEAESPDRQTRTPLERERGSEAATSAPDSGSGDRSAGLAETGVALPAPTAAPIPSVPEGESVRPLLENDVAKPAPSPELGVDVPAAAGRVVTAQEPEWLAPDAPEPETDFSWLDGGEEGTPSPAGSDASAMGRETAAADAAPSPTPVAASTPSSASWIGPAEEVPAEAEMRRRGADDFSFLDPDAPLPAEEDAEDADFSWLEPDAPLPPDDAAAGVSDEPHEAPGWRVREAAAAPVPAATLAPTTWFERLRGGLARSSGQLSGSITALFTKRKLDEATLQEFEDVLIQADLGLETALRITGRLSAGRFGKEISGNEVRSILAEEVEATLRPVALPLELDLEKKPHVILVVGVNGTGKTTTIGKLAAKLTRGGLKVTLCAGDTFRAAAVEQLRIWGERTGSEVVAKAIGADAAGLAFEAYDRAVANGSDVLIIDTAGRLQNKTELMAELEKIVRVLQRREPDAPHTVLQTLDATTGQNALGQVEIFRNVAGVNGLVMTKLDGTARGGILVAIAAKYRLPVYFIGVGEGIDDLEPFKARDFAMAIAGKT